MLNEIPIARLREELLNRLPLSLCDSEELIEELYRRGIRPKDGFVLALNERQAQGVEKDIVNAVCASYGLLKDTKRVMSNERIQGDVPVCRAVIYYLLRLSGLSGKSIALTSGVDPQTVSKKIKFVKETMEENEAFAKDVKEVMNQVREINLERE